MEHKEMKETKKNYKYRIYIKKKKTTVEKKYEHS